MTRESLAPERRQPRPAISRCATAWWTAPNVTVATATTHAFAMSVSTPQDDPARGEAPPVQPGHSDLVDHSLSRLLHVSKSDRCSALVM
jgi:hypothetical protein